MADYWRNHIFRYARFDVKAVCNLASELRKGHSCSCPLTQKPDKGSYNWVIFLDFDDGVQWVFRVPFDNPKIPTVIPPDVCANLIRSEVATMEYVAMNTDIPVPTVYSYSPTRRNRTGVPFILMSKAEGQPLSNCWNEFEDQPDIKQRIVYQLGQLAWKLAQHRFDRIGSLFRDGDSFKIGECLSRGRVTCGRGSLEVSTRRSFRDAFSFYRNLVEIFVYHASELPLYMHCFVASSFLPADYKSCKHYEEAHSCRRDFITIGNKMESANNRVDYVVAGYIIQDLLRQRGRFDSSIPLSKPFPLHHPDLNTNNVFVDEQCRITCIIDWSFSTTVPLEVLFAPPGLPQSRHELSKDLVEHFYNGLKRGLQRPSSEYSEDEAQVALNAADLFRNARFIGSLYHLLSFDSQSDFRLLQAIWQAVQPSDTPSLESHFVALRQDPQIQTLHELLLAKESPKADIEREVEDRFDRRGDFEHAVAMKLHVMSDWDVQYAPEPTESESGQLRTLVRRRLRLRTSGGLFMADGRLWNWLLLWKEEYSRIYLG